MLHAYFLYFFIICLVGVLSLGITVLTYVRTKDALVRDYLVFYSTFTASVFLNAFFSYIEANIPFVPLKVAVVLSYADILLVHLLMFSVPFFIHHLFQVPRRKLRNTIAAAYSIAFYLMFHVWTTAALIAEKRFVGQNFGVVDAGTGIMLVYSLVAAAMNYRHLVEPVRKKLALRFLLSFGILLPFIFYDLLVTMLFSPLLYVAISFLMGHHFITDVLHHPHTTEAGEDSASDRPETSGTNLEELAAKYTLSPREQEVLLLLLQGQTNQNIGEQLFISTNTVKTHISKIYQKVGVNRRYELLTLFKNVKLSPESPAENAS